MFAWILFPVREASKVLHAPVFENFLQGSAATALPLLTDKKRNHFTFDLVFMSASFIYLF